MRAAMFHRTDTTYSLPMHKILPKIPTLVDNLGDTHDHWLSAARAICTTDTFPKLRSRTFTLPTYGPNTTFTLTGMAKGAGMIHPDMATLLGIICTDAPVRPHPAQLSLQKAVQKSFNRISIDGDTSTNDTVALLANHAVNNDRYPHSIELNSAALKAFEHELTALATELAQLVVRDGEGATKFVTLRVRSAMLDDDKHRMAREIARSPLVKTALYGRDANWGRILCAIGNANLRVPKMVRIEALSVSFVGADGELGLLIRGEPQAVDEARAAEFLAKEDLEILIRCEDESDETRAKEKADDDFLFWTCDLSHEYGKYEIPRGPEAVYRRLSNQLNGQ